MSAFAIEKGIPLQATYKDKPCPYPFASMNIEDSFHVECEGGKVLSERSKLNAWLRKFRRTTGNRSFNIATRSTMTGFRVWRVA